MSERNKPTAEDIEKAENSITHDQKMMSKNRVNTQQSYEIQDRGWTRNVYTGLNSALASLKDYEAHVYGSNTNIDPKKVEQNNKYLETRLDNFIKQAQEIMGRIKR